LSIIPVKSIPEDTPLDRIYKAFVTHTLDTLSETDKGILTRITEIDKQMTARKPVKKVIKGKEVEFNRPYLYKELCEWIVERFGVSHRQAYTDIDTCKRFFLTTQTRDDQEFGRGQQIAIGNELLFEAASQGDYKSAAAFFKEINELMGLKRIMPETINPELLLPSEFVIVDDPSQLDNKFKKEENFSEMVSALEIEFKEKGISKIMDTAVDTDYESEETAT
jgi:hypothetical protein